MRVFPSVLSTQFCYSLCEKILRRSSVFAAMLESPMEESTTGILKWTGINFETAKAALRYIYKSEIRADFDNEVEKLFPCLTV